MKGRIPLLTVGGLLLGGMALEAFDGECPLQRHRELSGSHDSVRDLSTGFLAALADKDAQTIKKLGISKPEWDRFIWPELPAARPHTNLTSDFVWNHMKVRSDSELSRTLQDYGGIRYQLLSVRLAGKTTTYPSYTVHREPRLRIRDVIGKEREIGLFGAIVERKDEFKILTFVR